IEVVQEEVEKLEDLVLREQLEKSDIERLYLLRRKLLRLRNAVVPLVDVCRRYERIDIFLNPAHVIGNIAKQGLKRR
ncbi:hypothetical protein AB9F39_39655, partial [Rhizobium leguminosarum]